MKSQPRHILAIDQSTSATKALVYNFQGDSLDRFSIEHRPHFPAPGRVEHDAEEIWRNTISVIRQALQKHPDPLCLSITNQRETFVLFEAATGKPLHNAVVWQCRRGDDVCAALGTSRHADVIAAKTGLKIDSYFSAPKLSVLLNENLHLRAKLDSGEALFGTIDTYLLYRLTSGEIFATDATNASRTLLYNINTLEWDPQLCDLFNIPMRCLPEVRDSTARFGGVNCPELSLQIPIAGVMGDSQAALFAHHCFHFGQAKVTLGTGSSILLNAGHAPPSAGIRTIAWTHRHVPTYCLEGIISSSASTITWLRDNLGLIRSFDEVEPAATSIPDNGGVYFVPAFTGLAAPHWRPDARAAIVGLSASSTRGHILRAALESIAYQIKDALDAMTSRDAIPLLALHVDGGASNSNFLLQFLADILNTKILLSDTPDLSPLGSAFAGLLAMQVYSSLDQIAAIPFHSRTISPSVDCASTTRHYRGWQSAVRQVLSAK